MTRSLVACVACLLACVTRVDAHGTQRAHFVSPVPRLTPSFRHQAASHCLLRAMPRGGTPPAPSDRSLCLITISMGLPPVVPVSCPKLATVFAVTRQTRRRITWREGSGDRCSTARPPR